VVIDQKSKETLIGAVITVDGTNVKAITNIDGNFQIDGLDKEKTYTLYINYVGYKTQKIDGVQAKDADQVIALQPDEQQLKEVTVTAVERRNTDAAMIQVAKNSPVIVSNVSAQEISRTQDTNAGEVIRRVPGVSLIDDKFVMVRGLSQRYNNVWVNGGAVPSSEADSRAFSFDIIPSSQIDNLTIVKSPTAEYPADYSGGFIIVNTKEIPAENSFNIAVGGNWNTSSAFKDFSYSKGSGTDFLGFDNGLRNLNGGIHATLNPQLDANGKPVGDYATSLLGNGFNNDWLIKNKKPLGDLKLAASLNQRWMLGGRTLGMLAALNYTNEYRTYENMENNLYGIYDAANDKLYLLEEKQMRNNYRGHNTLGAGYLAMSLPFGKLGIHAGVRFEHNDMELIAKGTATEPIVFTSEEAAGSRKPGDWGGIILCGKAKNNQTEQQIEGGPRTKHGGADDADNSGTLSYVRIEFAGYPFQKDKEINGLTLGSVGSGTEIDHVQVSYSNDDSFEWFGGTVNCKYLVAYKGWDDDFDTDNGFSGKVQYGLSLRDSKIADTSQSNGFESDNCADGATVDPRTNLCTIGVFLVICSEENVVASLQAAIGCPLVNYFWSWIWRRSWIVIVTAATAQHGRCCEDAHASIEIHLVHHCFSFY
jgi:hypothetical protein